VVGPKHWFQVQGISKGQEFEGAEVNALESGEFNTVSILKFEKGGVCMTPPLLLWWRRPRGKAHQARRS